ncbi:MAG: tRNA(His) guanylyltransferase Thg1 family protein [Bacteroidaceae bacterium]|nr:tRNA(His) guanylyltransferase Thg1 family protein [Bacteroidaceae bacterium]
MPVHDDLGKRLKNNYENVMKYRLTCRTPVIIRIDGRAFHTFARKFQKPFDHILMNSMQQTMKYLCANIQGCVLGYTQSDEISLLLVDYQHFESQPWFDNEVQKITSISASMATMIFNKVFTENVNTYLDYYRRGKTIWTPEESDKKYIFGLTRARDTGAMFDSRCFNIPREEVTNYFFWRQNDATRNSIQMVGQAYFSHKELHKKTCSMIQEMLHEQKGINWNDFSVPEKRGTCCIKTEAGWTIDENIPIFKGDGREYVERFVYPKEDNT